MPGEELDAEWKYFASSAAALLAKIEEVEGADDEEKLRVLGPSFIDWSNYWKSLETVWFKWLKTKIREKYSNDPEEKIPITKKEMQIVSKDAEHPSEVLEESRGLMTRVWIWANDSPLDIPEKEDHGPFMSVWQAKINHNVLNSMKHWNDKKPLGGNWRDPADLKITALKVAEEYGYNRVKQLTTVLLFIVDPKRPEEEIEDALDLELRRRRGEDAERKKLADKVKEAGFEYFQDGDVYADHLKKLASRRVVCFTGKGALGKSALAVQITKDLLATEDGEGEKRENTEDGHVLTFPKFGTNYILKTTKSIEQGDFALHDDAGGAKAGQRVAPKIHRIADIMNEHQAFDEVLGSILKRGDWSAAKIRSKQRDEKRKAALKIIRRTPLFILLDNYEDIERNIHEKENFDSFLREYYETPETEAKKTYIIITSREGVDKSVAENSRIEYLSMNPSNRFLTYLLKTLPGQTYEYQVWMIENQAKLVSSFEKMHNTLSGEGKFGVGQGGFPPLIGLIAHTFLSRREKLDDEGWIDGIAEEVIGLFGDDLNEYVFGKSSKQIRTDFPHSWRCLEDFSWEMKEFTEEDLLLALEDLGGDKEMDPKKILSFLLECESRDLVEKTLHPDTGEHLYIPSIRVSISPGKTRKLEDIGEKSPRAEKIDELERELLNLEDGHGRDEFEGLLSKAKKITLKREFSVEEYDRLAKVILSLEAINQSKKWGRNKAADELKTKHWNRGVKRVQSLDELSFVRSGRFITDMIELAKDGKKINFSKILENIAELVNETDSALLLEDELAAAGLLEVLVASVESKDGLERLALKTSGSEAWLSILGKLISNPGIQQRELQHFTDFCLRVIEVNK